MRVRIHRGAHEIGGSCVEVEAADGSRVLLDLGRPLSAGLGDAVPLPAVAGLTQPDPSLLGVLVSHPHADHYGLIADLGVDLPIFLGREAAAILAAAAFFSPVTRQLTPAGFLTDRTPFALGPFTITPYLADHSAFDSYSLLVDADGKRLFYTGDLRGHGRKSALFERLLTAPPAVDVLLCEGTSVRSDGVGEDEAFRHENDLERELVDVCRQTSGAVTVLASAQNVDRLVTAYRAARRSGRTLVVDLYTATVAASTRASIPQPGFDALSVYVPQRQRVLVRASGEFDRVAAIRERRIFAEELAVDPARFLLYVPASTVRELITGAVLGPAGCVLWSMWDGYLADPSGVAVRDLLARHNVPLGSLHTSGHASVPDLRRLTAAFAPAVVVPMHTEAADRFPALFDRVTRHDDGTWWAA